MLYWAFFIKICVQICSVILLLSKKCISFPKKYIFHKNIKYSECILPTLSKYVQNTFEEKNKYITVTLGSKRGRMATCIVICIITVQANISNSKQRMSCCLMHKSTMI